MRCFIYVPIVLFVVVIVVVLVVVLLCTLLLFICCFCDCCFFVCVCFIGFVLYAVLFVCRVSSLFVFMCVTCLLCLCDCTVIGVLLDVIINLHPNPKITPPRGRPKRGPFVMNVLLEFDPFWCPERGGPFARPNPYPNCKR